MRAAVSGDTARGGKLQIHQIQHTYRQTSVALQGAKPENGEMDTNDKKIQNNLHSNDDQLCSSWQLQLTDVDLFYQDTAAETAVMPRPQMSLAVRIRWAGWVEYIKSPIAESFCISHNQCVYSREGEREWVNIRKRSPEQPQSHKTAFLPQRAGGSEVMLSFKGGSDSPVAQRFVPNVPMVSKCLLPRLAEQMPHWLLSGSQSPWMSWHPPKQHTQLIYEIPFNSPFYRHLNNIKQSRVLCWCIHAWTSSTHRSKSPSPPTASRDGGLADTSLQRKPSSQSRPFPKQSFHNFAPPEVDQTKDFSQTEASRSRWNSLPALAPDFWAAAAFCSPLTLNKWLLYVTCNYLKSERNSSRLLEFQKFGQNFPDSTPESNSLLLWLGYNLQRYHLTYMATLEKRGTKASFCKVSPKKLKS